LRLIFKGILDPIGAFLNSTGLTPNAITLLGLAGTTVGAYILSQGKMTTGAIVLFFAVIVDAFDGTMARLRGESSDFGAFVDSVSDRYAEFITFGGLLYFFLTQENYAGVMVTLSSSPLADFYIFFSHRKITLGSWSPLPLRLDQCWYLTSRLAQKA